MVIQGAAKLSSPLKFFTAFSATLWNFNLKHTQPFYGSVEFVRENPGEPVPEETFTHYSHRSHKSSLSAFSI